MLIIFGPGIMIPGPSLYYREQHEYGVVVGIVFSCVRECDTPRRG